MEFIINTERCRNVRYNIFINGNGSDKIITTVYTQLMRLYALHVILLWFGFAENKNTHRILTSL